MRNNAFVVVSSMIPTPGLIVGFDALNLGDLWCDTLGTPTLMICTALNPITFSGIGGGTGVTSLNSLVGALSLVAGTGITVTPSGSNITIASTGGGGAAVASNFHLVSAASTNANLIKNSPTTLFGVRVYNNANYPVFVKLFDKATAPVPGTDTPIKTFGVEAGTERDTFIGGGGLGPTTLGLGVAITKLIADNDATAIAVGDCVIDVEYT